VRTIKKRPHPVKLTQWRAPRMVAVRPEGMECTYEEMRRDGQVIEAVEDSLLVEQGGICAYTGHRIRITPADPASARVRDVDLHIEHLVPQHHCAYGQDTDYENMVACWPRPNCGFEPAYGARKKGSWPSPVDQALFVSPLRHDCSSRFTFHHRGGIAAANPNDEAADQTVTRLGLNHDTLKALRREAIRGALNPRSRLIRLSEARRLLVQMERAASELNLGRSATLMPFCFAIEPALRREIRKLEGILSGL